MLDNHDYGMFVHDGVVQAFDAALLEDVPSNCNGRQIAKLVGERKARYRVVREATEVWQDASREKLIITSDGGELASKA